jgi:TRAP-type mannitol/chloroaromatic compound transport system permease small subunit
MPKAIKLYVRYITAVNNAIGKFVMYWVLLMMGILLFETLSRTLFNKPHIWVVESSQFLMAAYYMLAGGYSMILDGHVRMDLLYERWSPRGKAWADVITVFFLFFYMVFLLIGSITAVRYAIRYHQVSYTPWAPSLIPIKIIMTIGIVLMLLQEIAIFFKDLATAMGREIV